MTRSDKARENFDAGYNCAQSVLMAFCDILPLDGADTAKLGSSFGAGMGRLREVCGALSAAFMIAGFARGYDDPCDDGKKAAHYADIQRIAGEFRERRGSILCRELLKDVVTTDGPVPEKRTAEYYARRPCRDIVGDAADIIEKYLEGEL